MLTKDAILNADDIKRELVAVPEWGGEVYVQTLTGRQRDLFEQRLVDQKAGEVTLDNIRATLAVWSVVDEDGGRVFDDSDIPALGDKSAAALDRIFDVAQRLSGLTDDDVDGLVKNSGQTPGGGSTSA